MPAVPARTRQLKQPHDAHQLVSGVRHQHLAGNPVPDGARRDVKDFPGSFGGQPGVEQQDFEACAQRGAGFAGLPGCAFLRTVVDTMCIMLSNVLTIACNSKTNSTQNKFDYRCTGVAEGCSQGDFSLAVQHALLAAQQQDGAAACKPHPATK